MKTLGDIAALLTVELPPTANPATVISGVNALTEAVDSEISFLSSEQYVKQAASSRAAAILVNRRVRLPAGIRVAAALLVVEDAELAVGRVLAAFAPPVPRPPVGLDPAATIALSAHIGPDCRVGPGVFVGQHARLGHRCVLHAGVYVGDHSVLGDDCELYPNVVVRERITIGSRVVVHACSVIGTDGFGYRWDGKRHVKIPQIGTVVIEDDVEIGSGVCIDRAKFAETRIGAGTKIDNLVQIGHNVRVGPHCILVGQSGIAGSAVVGAGVVLGGKSAIRDHVRIGDAAMVAACSGVMDDVPSKQVFSGTPALPHRQSLREQAALRELPDLRVQVRKLQEQVDQLSKALTDRQPSA